MKAIFKTVIINTLSITVASLIYQGINLPPTISASLYTATALTFLNLLVRPVINVLFLPINLLTLGIFKWLPPVLIIYLTTILAPSFSISPSTIELSSILRLPLPSIAFGLISSMIVATFVISLSSGFFAWTLSTKQT